ncbi:hypothetical protein [Deinococcus sp. QL22]|uniref:hypothetical protein n=1 Tax=Deinococcus sp. QL22 TaxID=2939437 RepID=UPI002016CEE8|nr:hypothetical protein [Deinococcus sp. QL22]UQN09744.1 hypothetical protein M1R55_25060 [Deinococcus sp. QL22]
MSLPAALSPAPPTPEAYVAEERGVFLPTRGHISFVGLHGQPLEKPQVDKPGAGKSENSQRLPYIESLTPYGVQVRLTDWVGRLTFTTESDAGRVRHPVLVYPAKLHEQPEQAFAALGRMADALPELGQRLNFPQGLLSAGSQLTTPTGSGPEAPKLLEWAGQAWQLWQLARRRPQLVQGHGQRVQGDGHVPDRVDWDLTFEHWGRGGFPGHVARDLAPPWPPAATSALLDLWDALSAAAQRLPQPAERTLLLTRFAVAKATLAGKRAGGQLAPNGAVRLLGGRTVATLPDPLARQAASLAEQVRQWSPHATGIPDGHTRMAELYELWALARLTQALGASSGEFQRDSTGLFTGTFRGNGVTVTLNPQLSFRGIGQGLQLLRPDLLAVFDDGRALVADVKYRPLDRLNPQQQREINDQLLRYMGLSHAATGLILWPGRADTGRPSHLDGNAGETEPQPTPYSPAQALHINPLPGERARMVRVRLHPNDPHGALPVHLRTLGFPGVFA